MARRASLGGFGHSGDKLHAKCAKALSDWDQLEDPADIEDAVMAFIPKDQPFREEAIETLAKMMQVDLKPFSDDADMIGAIVSAATFRVVRAENASGRRSQTSVSMSGGRVSIDDTLDMIKLVIVGDSGVGKTCLMLRFVKDEFVTSTRATIGMDFCTRQLTVDLLSASESSVVQRLTCQVWDTAGQEQFHSLTATYYRKAGGVMIVYDAHSRESFASLGRWVQQVGDNAEEDIVKMVVAAKNEGEVSVTEEEGKAFAEANHCLFASTSSKLGDGVLPAFKTLASHVLKAQEEREEEREGLWLNAGTTVALGEARKAKKKGCC